MRGFGGVAERFKAPVLTTCRRHVAAKADFGAAEVKRAQRAAAAKTGACACGTMRGFGGVAERFKAPVLKTGKGSPFVSSNLTASATGRHKKTQISSAACRLAFR